MRSDGLGEGSRVRDITPGKMESYQEQRLAEPSPIIQKNITACEVNKEVTCLKTIFNRAVRHGKLKVNPIATVKRLAENSKVKDITPGEFKALLDASEAHLKPIIQVAYTWV